MSSVPTRIIFKKGTAAEWISTPLILAVGEPGYETDTKKMKIGDGIRTWNLLPYFRGNTGPTGARGIQGAIGVTGPTGPIGPIGPTYTT